MTATAARPSDPVGGGGAVPPAMGAAVALGDRVVLPTPASYELSRATTIMRPAAFALGFVATASFLIWLATRSQPQLLVSIALVAAVVLDWISTRRLLRDPVVEVQNPADAVTGYPVSFVLRVAGVRRPVEVIPPPPVRGWSATVLNDEPVYLTLPTPPRGVMRDLVLDLSAGSPLGLFGTQRRVKVGFATPMFVGPAPLPHVLRWPYLTTNRLGLSPTAMHGRDLFRGVRDYVRGDSRRDVHWPATARHGRLMVKEHEGTGTISLRIVVDLHAFGGTADVAAGRAAWLAEEALGRGWLVDLVTVEPTGAADPSLIPLRPGGLYVLPTPSLRSVHTIDLPVQTVTQVRRRLAAAVPGRPHIRPWKGVTRVITSGGDDWL